jgi:hypothetical protein
VRVSRLVPAFIEQRPETLEEGVIYISVGFRTSVHLCCCGCGNEVWLPIRPARWKFTYDGQDVSFWPSVGNWSFPCRSHYWIRNGRVDRAPAWSNAQVEKGRQDTRDRDVATASTGEAPPRWWERALHAMRRRG